MPELGAGPAGARERAGVHPGPAGLEVLPVTGIGDITPGTDLAAAIVAAAPWLRDQDVLVVTSKIVSKAEGRLIDVPTGGPEREVAREEALRAETARPVARRGHTRIVQTHHGFVMASAGIDASNVERTRLVLLPKDPDSSARALRAAFRERFGLDVAVIVSDTMGRPWRNALIDVALGAAGIAPIRDYRGESDPYGNELHITQVAVIDELSSAAELVKGKCDQVPVAVVRGFLPGYGSAGPAPDGPGAVDLVRAAEHDLFSLGTAEARALGLRDAAELGDATAFADVPVDPGLVDQVLANLDGGRTRGFAVRPAPADLGPVLPRHTSLLLTCELTDGAAPAQLIRLGEDLHRVRCALAAAGLRSARLTGLTPNGGPTFPDGQVQPVLAIGYPATG
ncbi:MAG TPA: coenzyme F420-0:L-glutamate ligase [Micromonosporaceae bacterium]